MVDCAAIATERPFEDDEAGYIPLATGSLAELYIAPMLSCVGDMDIMFHCSSELAIPEGDPPPTQLPDEFHRYVKVFEIKESEFPGYVYLMLSYKLAECVHTGRYNTVRCDPDHLSYEATVYAGIPIPDHGPAFVDEFCYEPSESFQPSIFFQFVAGSDRSSRSVDRVFCVRCLLAATS